MQIVAPDLGIRNRPETKLLIHPAGADQSQVITDSSFGGPKTITVAGNAKNVAQDLRHPYARSAAFFPGTTSDYLTTPNSGDIQFTMTDEWSIECWIFIKSLPTNSVITSTAISGANYGTGMLFLVSGMGQLAYYRSSGSSVWVGQVASAANAVALNAWHFVQCVRDSSGVVKLYLDNNLVAYGSDAVAQTHGLPLTLGFVSSQWPFYGYTCDFRWRKGANGSGLGAQIAVPTSYLQVDSYTKYLIRGDNITQPTTFVDKSSSAHTITASGSVKTLPLPPGASAAYFDGSGDYLTVPASADFDFGANDFTIHFWACPTALPTDYNSFFGIEDASGYPGMFANFRSDGRIRWCLRKASGGNADVFDISSTATAPVNVQCHLAFVKSINSYKVFLNGNLIISTTGLASMETVNAPFYVGGRSSGYGFTGYIRGFTVARRAIWTRNFTPPNRLA